MRIPRALVPALIGLSLALGPASAQDPAKPKGQVVTLEAIRVTPKDPGPDTLCRLSVVLKNHGDRSLSSFGFRVRVNGTDLPVYRNQRYLEVLEPGTEREIELYNFWSSETHRPPRKDGSLEIEVSVIEARWVEMKLEDGVPTWTLLEPVKKLPGARTVRRPFPDAGKAGA